MGATGPEYIGRATPELKPGAGRAAVRRANSEWNRPTNANHLSACVLEHPLPGGWRAFVRHGSADFRSSGGIRMTPLVSVVTPVHNGAAFIRETIASVQAQTWGDWELLVVDDASEDDSAEVVEALAAEDERIRLFRLERNGGAAVARNTAIAAARGRYIAFLDGDDLWLPHKLDRQLAFMREKEAAFSYGAYERVDEKGRHLSPVGVPDRLRYGELLKTCYVGCLTAMYDTNVFGKRYMPLIRRRQDYALWLDLLRDGETAMGLNEVLGIYRVRSGSISANKASTSLYTWRMYREVEALSLARSAWCFTHQTGRAVVRHRMPGLARRLGWLHSVDGASAGDCRRPCGPSQGRDTE